MRMNLVNSPKQFTISDIYCCRWLRLEILKPNCSKKYVIVVRVLFFFFFVRNSQEFPWLKLPWVRPQQGKSWAVLRMSTCLNCFCEPHVQCASMELTHARIWGSSAPLPRRPPRLLSPTAAIITLSDNWRFFSSSLNHWIRWRNTRHTVSVNWA